MRMAKLSNGPNLEPRRGNEPQDEAFLRLVGERVRLMRLQIGMSRKALSQASGVSERYLAELERGSGNASLLVLRRIADALATRVHDLTVDEDDRSIDKTLAIQHLENLGTAQAAEARQLLVDRFGRKPVTSVARIALVGVRGAGKATLGAALARALGVPCVDLDREVERAAGIEVSEVFAVHGQEMFQRLQHESLGNLLNSLPRGVIKAGGGIVLAKETYDLLLAGCFVIWVRASLDSLNGRWGQEVASGEDTYSKPVHPQLEAALAERTPLYEMADAIIDTPGKTVQEAVDEVIKIVAERADRQGKAA
jgi:XRE family transcriptional regulator, aerobic/anaerobic benzoate catabolism transcriptional regulator